MISNMKLHLPLYHLKEHFLPGTNIYSVRKIMKKNPTYKANVKRLTFTWRRQSATDKKGGKIEVTWSLSPFTFHVNAVLNLFKNKKELSFRYLLHS